MNILVVGGGGREHVLAEKYSQSKDVEKVFVTPGNDLMGFLNRKIIPVLSIGVFDFEKIIKLIKKENIDFVDVAQDDPLGAGLVDAIKKVSRIKVFGPVKKSAEIEWNKVWSRDFMEKYNLPIPKFKYFSDTKLAIEYVNKLPQQVLYIKAAGLAAGKGVIRAENKEEAKAAILSMKQFGKSGKKFLIEEAMIGEEFSLFAICDGINYKIINFAQDHKTVFEKDQGPNTGGMGCVAPALILNKESVKIVEEKIVKPFMIGMQKEKRPYSGILYVGGMVTKNGIKIVEFNARWGDPEAEVILPSIKTDYLELAEKTIQGKLDEMNIEIDNKVRISIAGCAKGYPEDYSAVKGKEVTGIKKALDLPEIKIYGAGIKKKGNKFVVNGGRVFHLVAEGKNIIEARKKAYAAIRLINVEGNNLHYRKDIGWRDLERLQS